MRFKHPGKEKFRYMVRTFIADSAEQRLWRHFLWRLLVAAIPWDSDKAGKSSDLQAAKASVLLEPYSLFSARYEVVNPQDLISRRILRGVPWEPHLQALARWILLTHKGRWALVDVGANIGAFSLPLRRLCQRLVLVEADSDATTQLRRNVSLNSNAGGPIEIHETLVGLPDYPYVSSRRVKNNLGATQFQRLGTGESSKNGARDGVSLDSVVSLNENAENVMMKIDVEGLEEDVIKGADAILQRRSVILFVEIKPPNFGRVSSLLGDYGFTGLRVRRSDYVFWRIKP